MKICDLCIRKGSNSYTCNKYRIVNDCGYFLPEKETREIIIENLLQQNQSLKSEVTNLKSKISDLEESTFELESRIEELELENWTLKDRLSYEI